MNKNDIWNYPPYMGESDVVMGLFCGPVVIAFAIVAVMTVLGCLPFAIIAAIILMWYEQREVTGSTEFKRLEELKYKAAWMHNEPALATETFKKRAQGCLYLHVLVIAADIIIALLVMGIRAFAVSAHLGPLANLAFTIIAVSLVLVSLCSSFYLLWREWRLCQWIHFWMNKVKIEEAAIKKVEEENEKMWALKREQQNNKQ